MVRLFENTEQEVLERLLSEEEVAMEAVLDELGNRLQSVVTLATELGIRKALSETKQESP